MQYTLLNRLAKAGSRNYTGWAVRLGLLLLFGYFLLSVGWQTHLSLTDLQRYIRALFLQHPYLLLTLLFLMCINWGLEAAKWRLLVKPLQELSLAQASRGVLAGLALAFVTPRGLGDYAGRLWQSPVRRPLRLLGGVWMGRMAQASITYAAGLLGLLYLLPLLPHRSISTYYLMLIAAVLSLLLLLALSFWFRVTLSERLRQLNRKLGFFLLLLEVYPNGLLHKVHGLAALRYLVFALQFYLLLWLSVPAVPAPALCAAVSLIFLVKSLIPSFNFLNDLGIREFSSLLVFTALGQPAESVIWASLLLWFINILLPSIFGCAILLQTRWEEKRIC